MGGSFQGLEATANDRVAHNRSGTCDADHLSTPKHPCSRSGTMPTKAHKSRDRIHTWPLRSSAAVAMSGVRNSTNA